MSKQTVQALVTGGKASAGPPLGPALGPLGVKIPDVIAAINQKTRDMAGMNVPVKVVVDTATKAFTVEVGTPPVSALIKKELGLEKGSKEAGKLRAGDLSEDQVKRVARVKFGGESPALLSQVRGTARSMGITVGKGAVTQEEIAAYERVKKAEEEAAAAKAAAAAPAAGAAPAAAGEEKAAEPAKAEGKKAAPAGAKPEPKKPEKKGK